LAKTQPLISLLKSGTKPFIALNLLVGFGLLNRLWRLFSLDVP